MRRLRQRGIEPQRLRDEMLSYKTFLRHVQSCEGLEQADEPSSQQEAKNTARDRIAALERRLDQVAAKTLRELTRAGHILLDSFDP